jgi:hypothetical protein
MLGSVAEAEDIVQEALVRVHRTLEEDFGAFILVGLYDAFREPEQWQSESSVGRTTRRAGHRYGENKDEWAGSVHGSKR